MPGMPYKIMSIVTRKLEGVKNFHYYLCRQLKGGGMEIYMLKRKIPYVAQLGSMDCGSACLTMLFNYYGIKADIVDVGSLVYIGRDGMSLATMKEVANKFGFNFNAYRYEYNQNNLDQMLPVILYSGSHYAIIEKKTRRGEYIIIDPAKGHNKISFGEIKSLYTDIFITIRPDKPVNINNNVKLDVNVKKGPFIVITLLLLVIQIITILVPLIIRYVVDGISVGNKLSTICIIFTIIIVVTSYFGLSWMRQAILLNLDMDIFRNLVTKMLKKLFRIDLNFFEWHAAGDIGNRFNNINQLNDVITNGIVNVLIQSVTSAICLIVMLYNSLELTGYIVIISMLELFLLYLINKRNMEKTTQYIRAQSVLQSDLIDTLGNMTEIKCIGLDTAIYNRLQGKYENQIFAFKQKTSISNLMNCFVSTVTLVFPLIIYLVGSLLISKGSLTMGALIAYVTLANYFVAPFTTIVMMLPNINSIKEVVLRYKELMNYHEYTNTGIKIEGELHKICLNNITYSYAGGNSAAINDVSLEINKGETIAIVGVSGSGKSTLIKAILGAVELTAGEIFFNDRKTNEISREQIYNWFSIVTQNPMCLNSTIRKNVDITDSYSDEQIWAALDLAEVKKDVEGMPLKLDTMIGEGGQNISGGQRQRLAIARALIADSEVVIFDEATSNLDPLTEKNIYENLKRSNKTLITVTHRLVSIQNADRIYVLNKGKLIEKGTHSELMNLNGWYHDSFENSEIF